jgi:hypothetical protein
LNKSEVDDVTKALFINWTHNKSYDPSRISEIFLKILKCAAINNIKQAKKLKESEPSSYQKMKSAVQI